MMSALLRRWGIAGLSVLFTSIISCSSTAVEEMPTPQKSIPQIELNETFLRDIENASKVINENNLVLSLTHLQAMDKGGKKYYLLEKETISYLLKSVTKNLYRNIVLVNWEGVIVYSMRDDGIFAGNVLEATPPSSLAVAYKTAMEGRIFASSCDKITAEDCTIASPLDKDEKRWGVIVLLVKSDSTILPVAQKAKETSVAE
jgi:hypothetical protein